MVTAWNVCFFFLGLDRWEYMDVSKNRGTPKSSILIGFSLINHLFWGTPIFGNTHIYIYTYTYTYTYTHATANLLWWVFRCHLEVVRNFELWFWVFLFGYGLLTVRPTENHRLVGLQLRLLGDSVRYRIHSQFSMVFPHHYEKSLFCLFVALISMDTSDKTVWL